MPADDLLLVNWLCLNWGSYCSEMVCNKVIIIKMYFSFISHAGRSRSACVVTAYLMKTHKMSVKDAYSKLQDMKPDVKYDETISCLLTEIPPARCSDSDVFMSSG